MAEEVRDPERNVPLALGLGTLAVIVIYLGLNALYLYALPVAELASVPGGARLIDTVAERLFGFVAGGVLAAFSIVSLAASISAMMIAGPRVYFAMARDGVFAPTAGEIHPRSHAPAHAIIAQAIWSGVLVLSGTLVAAGELHRLCRRAVLRGRRGRGLRPAAPATRPARPFRAWGYPWAPAIFVLASALMLANEIWSSPRDLRWPASAVIAAGSADLLVDAAGNIAADCCITERSRRETSTRRMTSVDRLTGCSRSR